MRVTRWVASVMPYTLSYKHACNSDGGSRRLYHSCYNASCDIVRVRSSIVTQMMLLPSVLQANSL
eukprot:2244502-Pleurochrysis_carterae.AAC.1